MPLGVDELLVGAVVGAAASELLTAILDAKDKTSSFKSSMDTLKSTLETIIPKIERIKLLDGQLNGPTNTDIDNIISELKKGKDLVCKCSMVNRFNIYQKYRYAKRLEKLDVSLRGFFSLKVNVEIWSDTKRILAHLQETSVVSGNVDQNEGQCAVPEIPNFSVGMDARIEELKMELFRDDVSIIGLCAIGGSGKTTLAAKLCRDEQVKELKSKKKSELKSNTLRIEAHLSVPPINLLQISSAHVRGHQVRKQYKKFIWSVSIVEKTILRWRRKGAGLRGFRAGKAIENTQSEIGKTDEYEFLCLGRKQKVAGVENALARVQSMVRYSEACDQYMTLVTNFQKLKMAGDENEDENFHIKTYRK